MAKLPQLIQDQFKKILIRRLINPHVPKSKLKGKLKDCYKIKLLKAGFRLVYQVKENKLVVYVIAVGKRADNFIYQVAEKR